MREGGGGGGGEYTRGGGESEGKGGEGRGGVSMTLMMFLTRLERRGELRRKQRVEEGNETLRENFRRHE